MAGGDKSIEVLWAWVHLSDIHFGHGTKSYLPAQKDLIAQIIKDIPPTLQREGIPDPQAVLITGDIAYSGGIVRGPAEYADAVEFLNDLRSILGEAVPVYAVPGNHDVQRTSEKNSRNAWRLLCDLRDSPKPDKLDDAISDAGDSQMLSERFANYNEFCQAVGSPIATGPDGLWIKGIDLSSGRSIHLVGINTALLSNDDADFRRLNVPHATTTAAFSGVKDELVFVLTHHPVDWLDQNDVLHVTQKFRRDVDVHLHGHIHRPDTKREIYGTGEQIVTITAGAVHADEGESKAGTPHTYSLAALVRLEDDSIAIRQWPRRWSEERGVWVRDGERLSEDSPFVTQIIRGPLPPTAPPPPTEANAVRQAAEALVAKVGRKRTAFPTDMSIGELHDANLIIPTAFGPRHVKAEAELLAVDDLITEHVAKHILLLGAPGAGKTVLAYELSRALLQHTDRLPFFLDINSSDSAEFGLTDVLRILDLNEEETHEEQLRDHGVIIVDGVDEALSAGTSASDVASRLDSLSRICPLVVSCRAHDFDFGLSAHMRNDMFDEIWHVRDWNLEQFGDFVDRLHKANLLTNNTVEQRVAASTALQVLVRRPLLARMLTFLADRGDLPFDQTSLYAEYMSRLGLVTDSRVRAVGCTGVPEATDLWRSLSWFIFSLKMDPDNIPPAVIARLAAENGTTEKCVTRGLVGVLDLEDRTSASYIHYSFFEFLTVQHISLMLQRDISTRPDAVIPLLRRHLSIEMRHFLVELLRASGQDLTDWPQFLSGVYRSAIEESTSSKLVVRNLVAYLACRLGVPAHNSLHELLETERDPFLRNSLLWALMQQNNWDALLIYISELNTDDLLAVYNRGYLLYYYGDLPESVDPPHADVAPFTDWSRTRVALNEKYNSASYESVPPTRKAIDTYTFCDIATARGDILTQDEADRFRAVIESLRVIDINSVVLDAVSKKLAGATGGLR